MAGVMGVTRVTGSWGSWGMDTGEWYPAGAVVEAVSRRAAGVLVRGLLGCLLGRLRKLTCCHRRLLLLLLNVNPAVGALNWLRSQSCAIMHHWTEDRGSRTHGTLRGGQILVKQREAIILIHDVHFLPGEPKPSDPCLGKCSVFFLENDLAHSSQRLTSVTESSAPLYICVESNPGDKSLG